MVTSWAHLPSYLMGTAVRLTTYSSAEDKNEWNYTSTPLYVPMARAVIKYRESFTLYLIILQ
jgi:hypothetical protein